MTPPDHPDAPTRRPARRRAAPSPPPPPQPAARLLARVRWTLLVILLALLLWAALWPLRYPTRERGIDFARAAPVPSDVRLTLGVRDVLLLHNRDSSAHVFGQGRVLPGRSFRLPFEQEGEFLFACDAAPGNTVRVRVQAHPDPGWERLRWRLAALADSLRELPVRGPQD